MNNISGLPARQSNWCHIPIGRILDPVGELNFKRLQEIERDSRDDKTFSIKLDSLKMVEEYKWYMEEKDLLMDIKLT